MSALLRRGFVWSGVLWMCWSGALLAGEPLRIATFRCDATPPLGTPLCEGLVMPALRVDDPLTARGIVLLGAEKPIVLCAVDWVGIGNDGYEAWRRALAEAAGTDPRRVAVHTLHPHDAPGCDFSAEALLKERGLGGAGFDPAFAEKAIARAAAALRESLRHPRVATHVGQGRAKVEKVASNRRVLGPDGKVKHVRFSSCRDPEAIAAPEGVIDPYVRVLSFWEDDRPLAVLSYYATHPQSYYGKGGISADFVGMARTQRERELPGVPLIHFNGASGNVAAGKYNDGSPERRPILAGRLATGMKAAWDATEKTPIDADAVGWKVVSAALPLRDTLDPERLRKRLDDPQVATGERVRAARDLAWAMRMKRGDRIDLTRLSLGSASILHLPGELFVEYELAAQAMRPNQMVCMAAYGDYGPGYIGTRIAYGQGGYETSRVSRTTPEVEAVLIEAIRELLKD